MTKRKRCPNKTRRAKDGKCRKRRANSSKYSNQIKDSLVKGYNIPVNQPIESVSTTAYQKATYADVLIPNRSDKTFRTAYYNKFFNKPVSILENNPLFQVYVNDVGQFFEYVSIHTKSKHGYNDCFLHSLFSIGLRNVPSVRTDVSRIYDSLNFQGTITSQIPGFLETSFGLPKKSINPVFFRMPKINKEERNYSPITKLLRDWLKPNYATMLYLEFLYTPTQEKIGHMMNAFNYNNQIWYFNPQNNYYSTSLEDVIPYDNIITLYGLYTIYITKPQTIQNDTCAIPFRL